MVSDIPDLQITWLAPFGMLLSDTAPSSHTPHNPLLLIMGALSPSVIGAAEESLPKLGYKKPGAVLRISLGPSCKLMRMERMASWGLSSLCTIGTVRHNSLI